MSRSLALSLLLALPTFAGLAHAGQVSLGFGGYVADVTDPTGLLPGLNDYTKVHLGNGFVFYEETVPDSNPSPYRGEYAGALQFMHLKIENYSFDLDNSQPTGISIWRNDYDYGPDFVFWGNLQPKYGATTITMTGGGQLTTLGTPTPFVHTDKLTDIKGYPNSLEFNKVMIDGYDASGNKLFNIYFDLRGYDVLPVPLSPAWAFFASGLAALGAAKRRARKVRR